MCRSRKSMKDSKFGEQFGNMTKMVKLHVTVDFSQFFYFLEWTEDNKIKNIAKL